MSTTSPASPSCPIPATTTRRAGRCSLHAWLTPNVRNGILGNKQFRQGLMHAIDREFGREVFWSGLGKLPTGPISSKTRFYSADVPKYDFDLKKAKELIKASGSAKGETIVLLTSLPYGETWSRWSEAIQQNLEDVGVKVQIENTDVPGWTQKVQQLGLRSQLQLPLPASATLRWAWRAATSRPTSPRAIPSPMSAATPIRRSTSSSPRPRSRPRIRSGRNSRRRCRSCSPTELPVLWLLEMDFPTIYRCNVKNLVTTGVGGERLGFRDAWKE